MQYYGYMGKILYVDLTSGDIREEELDLSLAQKWIGDFGLSARLAYDLIKPGIDPLSPENPIIIGAGPFPGTPILGASRCTVWTKYPATNTIGPGSGPMGFSSRLKWAGYDELVITGRASKPVYLRISDDDVEICDAGNLWGRDVYEATDEIWRRHGTSNGVICIGQAGENLVKISLALIDKQGSLGRFGLGAIMGSKKLKLITTGGRRGVKISDPAKYTDLTDEIMREVMAWPVRDEFIRLSHMELDFDRLYSLVSVPNYDTDKAFDIVTARKNYGPEPYVERLKKARFGCPGCPVACRDVLQIKHGEYQGQIIYHQGFTHNYPIHLQLQTIEEGAKYIDICERYGIDKMSATQSIEFLIDLCKRGIITKDDLEGFEIGDGKSAITLMEKIVFRQGIGNIVADGREGIIKKVGREVVEKYGHYIKGADCWINPRKSLMGTIQLDLALNPVGPVSGKGGQMRLINVDPSANLEEFYKFGEKLAIPKEQVDRILDSPLKLNVGRLLRHSQDFYTAYSSLGQCMRSHVAQFYSIDRLAQLYSAVTGIEMEAKEMKKAGERAWNMFKVLNVREGQSRKDDRFPQATFTPLKFGDEELRLMDLYGTKLLTAEDVEQMTDDYYDERGWEVERGIPTKKKLTELGLADIAEDLDKSGTLLK